MYHVLRRQMKRNFRKPLVVAGPKGCNFLLRFSVEGKGLYFQTVGYGTWYQVLKITQVSQCLKYLTMLACPTLQWQVCL